MQLTVSGHSGAAPLRCKEDDALIGGGRLGRGDADEAAAAATVFKLHVTSDQREKRIVLALADVFTGLMLGAALTHKNCAGVDQLASEALYAEPLSMRIAAVC